MVTRRDFIKKSGLAIAAAAMSSSPLKAMMDIRKKEVAGTMENGYISNRPKPEARHFTSRAVEELQIQRRN